MVTSGTFDGVHLGHQKILNRLKEIAQRDGGETCLITFHPHPRLVLQKDCDLKLLNTIEERIDLIEKEGIDHLIILEFTKEFSRLTSLSFIRDIIVNTIHTKKLVIGYDHHFGRNREGSFEHLQEFGPLYGFEVEEIPAQDIDDVNVSSTKIRKAIADGDVQGAATFLGRNYMISGKVVKGAQLGRTIGFPTANIEVNDSNKLIPKNGVYAVRCEIDDKSYEGMINIGYKPTVNHDRSEIFIEVHLFGVNFDMYDKIISIEFVKKIRNELKFESVEELKNQLVLDKKIALNEFD